MGLVIRPVTIRKLSPGTNAALAGPDRSLRLLYDVPYPTPMQRTYNS